MELNWSSHQGPNVFFTSPWWRHELHTLTILLFLCEGNPPVTHGFPSQTPVIWIIDIFFVARLNKLNKQSSCLRFQKPWHSSEVTVVWYHGGAAGTPRSLSQVWHCPNLISLCYYVVIRTSMLVQSEICIQWHLDISSLKTDDLS